MTKKKTVLFAAAAVCLCCAAPAAALTAFRYQNTSIQRPADRYEGRIPPLESSADQDRDGIDDQTDILQGALSYVSSRPKYRSRYYEGGYPDDGYGVCTDVVAAALKNAGYDLRELVREDQEENPGSYGIDVPDPDIDFRRVKNLKVFFRHSAISLTTDISAIDQWQGGDIVIFENHIGIVSDRRNEAGIPFVIHHNGPWQAAYEQDILETRDDIVGHYRMSG